MHVELSVARGHVSLFPVAAGALDDARLHASNLERSLAVAVEYAQSLEQHTTQLEQGRADAIAYALSLERALAARNADSGEVDSLQQ
jgi:hypothetical protein